MYSTDMTREVVKMKKLLVKLIGKPVKTKIERWVQLMPLLNRLKEYRARLGVNQQEMGTLVGTSRQTISQIERGDYSPSVTLALKIAKVCNATVEEIFTYEEGED